MRATFRKDVIVTEMAIMIAVVCLAIKHQELKRTDGRFSEYSGDYVNEKFDRKLSADLLLSVSLTTSKSCRI